MGEKAKAVMAQRSKNCHAPSEQFFGHRKSASKGKAFARNKFESCPRNHHRTLKMIQFLVSYFFALNLVNKGFSAFVCVFVSSADIIFVLGIN